MGKPEDVSALPEDSIVLFYVARGLHFLLSAVAPASFAYLAARSYTRLPASPYLTLYAFAEAAFFCFYLYRRQKVLQDEHVLLAPAPPERERLFERVKEAMDSTEDVLAFLLDWHHVRTPTRWRGQGDRVKLEDLKRGNVEELLAAAFFNQTLEDVRGHGESGKALDRYVSDIEQTIHHAFPPGYNESISSIRHMIEEVPIEHKPLIFYVATIGAGKFVAAILSSAGFERRRLIAPLVSAQARGRKQREGQAFEYFYAQPLVQSNSWVAAIYRLWRPGPIDTSAKLPIVVSAGLAGTTGCFHVALYLLWIQPTRPIFLVGLPAVSLRLKEIGTRPRTPSDVYYSEDDFGEHMLWQPTGNRSAQVRPTIPTLDLQTRGLRMMIDKHGGFGSAIFVSHSLGTSLLSFASRMDPQLVAASIMVDPIVFLIWDSRLVATFLYKQPQNSGEAFIALFSREIGISSVVSRAFFWHQSAAFIKPANSRLTYTHDTVDSTKTHVILSSEDVLVPSRRIAAKLGKAGIRCTLLEGTGHAGFLLNPWVFLRVLRIVAAEADAADKRASLSQAPSFRPPFPSRKSSTTTAPMMARRTSSGFFGPPLVTTPFLSAEPSRAAISPMALTSLESDLPGLRRRASSIMSLSPSTAYKPLPRG